MDLAWTARDGTGAGRRSSEAVTCGKVSPTSGEVAAAASGRHTGHNTQMGVHDGGGTDPVSPHCSISYGSDIDLWLVDQVPSVSLGRDA